MMWGMAMLSEALLKEKFMVWGKFQEVDIAGVDAMTRPEARILRRGSPDSRINDEKHRADAVIVMSNPGSCMPISGTASGEWTEAKPDRTQLQLMRLMERMTWDELVIVNLSDLCDGNHENYSALLKRCEVSGIAHSRFAMQPESEWSKVISSSDRLLYGWGGNKEAKKMASAYGLLNLDNMFATHGKMPVAVWHSVKGYPKHPYPYIADRCEAWVEDMVEVLHSEESRQFVKN